MLCEYAADPSDESSHEVVEYLKVSTRSCFEGQFLKRIKTLYDMSPEEYAREVARK